MTTLARDQTVSITDVNKWRLLTQIFRLQKEIAHLNSVVETKDAALEEIMHFFNNRNNKRKNWDKAYDQALHNNIKYTNESLTQFKLNLLQSLKSVFSSIIQDCDQSIRIMDNLHLAQLESIEQQIKVNKIKITQEKVSYVNIRQVIKSSRASFQMQNDFDAIKNSLKNSSQKISQQNQIERNILKKQEAKNERPLDWSRVVLVEEKAVQVSRVVKVPVQVYLPQNIKVSETPVIVKDWQSTKYSSSALSRQNKLQIHYLKTQNEQLKRLISQKLNKKALRQDKLQKHYLKIENQQLKSLLQLKSKNQVQTISYVQHINLDEQLQNRQKILQIQSRDYRIFSDKKIQNQVNKVTPLFSENMKIVQVPVQIHIKEHVPAIYQLNAQLVQKQMSQTTQSPVIKQIPVDLFVESDKILELPVEVIIQKQVFITCVVQVPLIIQKQVVIQKQVIVQKQVFVDRQIPFLVIEQKICTVIKQIPIQLIIQPQKSESIEALESKLLLQHGLNQKKQKLSIRQIPVQMILVDNLQHTNKVPLDEQLIKKNPESSSQHQNESSLKSLQKGKLPVVPYSSNHNHNQEAIIARSDPTQSNTQLPTITIQFVEVPVQIYVQKIMEVPVQVFVQKIVHVPVEVTKTKYIQVQKIIQEKVVVHEVKQSQKVLNRILQIPVQMEPFQIQQQTKPKNLDTEQQIQKDFYLVPIEIPVDCFVEKIVEVQKIVPIIQQIPILLQVKEKLQFGCQNVKYPQCQNVKYPQQLRLKSRVRQQNEQASVDLQKVQKLNSSNPWLSKQIVQVPVPIIIEKQVQIIRQIIVEKVVFVQVPVEIVVIKEVPAIIQLPVQVDLENKIAEIPVEMVSQPLIYQIPTQLQTPPSIVEIPIQMQVILSKIKPQKLQKVSNSKTQKDNLSKTVVELNSSRKDQQYVVYQLPLNQVGRYKQIQLVNDNQLGQNEQIIVEFPIARQTVNQQVQTTPQITLQYAIERQHLKPDLHNGQEVISSLQIKTSEGRFQDSSFDVATLKMLKKEDHQSGSSHQVRLVEVPIQLNVINQNYQLQVLEIPIEMQIDASQQQLEAMKLKFNLRQNQTKQLYEDQINSLLQTIDSLQKVLLQSENQIFQLKEKLQNQALNQETLGTKLAQQQNSSIDLQEKYQELQRSHQQIKKHLTKREQQLSPKNICQDAIVEFLQIPFQLPKHQDPHENNLKSQEVKPQLTAAEIPTNLRIVDQKNNSNIVIQISDQKSSSGEKTQQLKAFKKNKINKFQSGKNQTNSIDLRSDPFLPLRFNSHQNNQESIPRLQYRNSGELLQMTLISGIDAIDENATDPNTTLLNGFMGQMAYYQMINQLKIYQYACEVMPEPIIYEVAVPLQVQKDVNNYASQTNDQLLPLIIKEIAPIQIKKSSQQFSSRFLQIPIQLQMLKQTKQVGIQYQQRQPVNQLMVQSPVQHRKNSTKQKIQSTYNTLNSLDQPEIDNQARLISIQQEIRLLNQQDPVKLNASNPLAPLKDRQLINSRQIASMHQQQVNNQYLAQNLNEALEEKQKLLELYQDLNHTYKKAKNDLKEASQKLENINKKYQEQSFNKSIQIKDLNMKIVQLNKENQQKEFLIQSLRTYQIDYKEKATQLQQKIEGYENDIFLMKQQSEKIAVDLTKKNQRLKSLLMQRINDINELKIEERQSKQQFQAQINELRTHIQQKDKRIDELDADLQKTSEKVQQYIESHQQMRKAIHLMQQNQQINHNAIYQQQFQRIKDQFQSQKRQYIQQIKRLQQEIETIQLKAVEDLKIIRELENDLAEQTQEIDMLKSDNSKLNHLKSQIENQYVEGIKNYSHQVQVMKQRLQQKNKEILIVPASTKLSAHPIQPVNDYNTIRMQHLSSKVSRNQEGISQSIYIKKLQGLLLKYEKMVIFSHGSYSDIQESMCEYLQDALRKQQEVDLLLQRLTQYQKALNNILVQKVTCQIENKQLRKSIDYSQKKAVALNHKLVQMTNKSNRLETESQKRGTI